MKLSTPYCAIKFVLGIFLSLVAFMPLKAQFDSQYSQYIYNHAFVNPAAAGERTMMQVSLLQRMQWIGVKNAPITTLVSAHAPFKIGASSHGAGIQFVSDIFGIFANQQINFQYAYKHKLGDGFLSAGVNLGMINIILNGDSVHMAESEYHTANDPIVPTGQQTGVGFDGGLGMQYATEKWQAGIAVHHLTSPKVELGDLLTFTVPPYMTAYGAYSFGFRNPDYKLNTSLLIASDFSSWTMHGAMLLNYKDKFWGGLGYRLQDAVTVMLGVNIFKGFSLGYSYDMPTNEFIKYSYGSHELFLAYEFSFLVRKKDRSYKSIRIL